MNHIFIQYSNGITSRRNSTRSRNKGHPNWKARYLIVFVYEWHHLIFTKKPKYSTKKLLESINKFSKLSWYKVNIQKLIWRANFCLPVENNLKKNSRNNSIYNNYKKILRIYVTKKVKNLYNENNKTLIKVIEKGSEK